ncbi:hypothetical protein FO519_002429 [Halicephalobus sp. NKZ332]|nr:hypothetical protein FO519_002429 [Halicephalobus sp. NKZ332]
MVKLSLPTDKFQAIEKLPNPSFIKCIVYKGRNEETKENVLIWRLTQPSESELNSIKKSFFHSCFLKVKETFTNENKGHFFITNQPRLGSLTEYLKNHGPLSESGIRSVMKQLLEVADFLQKQQLVHLCFDVENIFVEEVLDEKENNAEIKIKISPFGLLQHCCSFCSEKQDSKKNDSCYTTDYCKHIRDLALSLLMVLLALLRGKRRSETLLEKSEIAQDEYRRETEALANELMLKAFCGNVEYSVDADIKYPFKSLLEFKHHHFSPRSISEASLNSAFSDNNEKSIASAPTMTQQQPPCFQRAPSEVFQTRAPSRTGELKNGINRSITSLRSMKSSKSMKSGKSVKSTKSGKSGSMVDGTRWPLPKLPVEQRVCRVTDYGRFIYDTSEKTIFEFTNGTGMVQGICEVQQTPDQKQKLKLFKPLKSGPLPSQNEDLVKHAETPTKEFDSSSKLDSTAICLYHMICNDIEAFLSHTAAWILRAPFAIPGAVGMIMHSGDVQLTFGEHNSTYFRKMDSDEIVTKNGGPELSLEQLEVFEAVSLVLESHRSAWQNFSFIRSLKTDLTCYLSPIGPIFPINPGFVLLQPQVCVEDQYKESLEEFNRFRIHMALPGFQKFNQRFFIHHQVSSDSVFKVYKCMEKESHSAFFCLVRDFVKEEEIEQDFRDFFLNCTKNMVLHQNLHSFIEVFSDKKETFSALVTEEENWTLFKKYVKFQKDKYFEAHFGNTREKIEESQNDSEEEFDVIQNKDDRESTSGSWEAVVDERGEFDRSMSEYFQNSEKEEDSYEIGGNYDISEVRTDIEDETGSVEMTVEDNNEARIVVEDNKVETTIEEYNEIAEQVPDKEIKNNSQFTGLKNPESISAKSFGYKIPSLKFIFNSKPVLNSENGIIEYGKDFFVFVRTNKKEKFIVFINLVKDFDEISNVVFEVNCGKLMFNHISEVNSEVIFALSSISVAIYDVLSKTITVAIKNPGNIDGLTVEIFGNNGIKYIYKNSVLHIRNAASVFSRTKDAPEILSKNYGKITSEILLNSFQDIRDAIKIQDSVLSKRVQMTFYF